VETLRKERLSGTRPLLLAVMERIRFAAAPADAGRRRAFRDALCRAPYCLRKLI
jgi:hypothetical protein